MNRKIIIAIGAVLVIIILAGGYFLFAGKSKKPVTTDQSATSDTVLTLAAKDIGLSISDTSDKKRLNFQLPKRAI